MKTNEIKFVCDICGKEFKTEDSETSYTIKVGNSRYRIEKEGGYSWATDYLDICKECKEKFARVLEGEK